MSKRWNAGKTSETDEKVKLMSERVSEAHRDPVLRKRLDDMKRRTPEEVKDEIERSGSKWTLVSGVEQYTRQDNKNMQFVCDVGHTSTLSLNDVVSDVRCKTCHPKKNAGKSNPAYCDINNFNDRLLTKFGADRFSYDAVAYAGVYHPIDFTCNECKHAFTKAPRVLLNEKHGCVKCSRKHTAKVESRTYEQFVKLAKKVHGNKFTYKSSIDQTWRNVDVICWVCNTCQFEHSQQLVNHLDGRSCPKCSGTIKHTTETFIARSQQVHGPDTFDYSQVVYGQSNKQHIILKCKKHDHVFTTSPANHVMGKGCPDCAMKTFVSAGETEWLNSLNVHASCRNRWINVNGQKFNVDGLVNGTIYEYYGDYWHGNPLRFPADRVCHTSGMTMAELYQHTMDRESQLKAAGYVVITMWEFDWMRLRQTRAINV